jgi:hypothetical protein
MNHGLAELVVRWSASGSTLPPRVVACARLRSHVTDDEPSPSVG